MIQAVTFWSPIVGGQLSNLWVRVTFSLTIPKRVTFSQNCQEDDLSTLDTLPETNSSPLKIGLPNRKVVFQPSIFRDELLVSGSVSMFQFFFGTKLRKESQSWLNLLRSCGNLFSNRDTKRITSVFFTGPKYGGKNPCVWPFATCIFFTRWPKMHFKLKVSKINEKTCNSHADSKM